MPLYFVGGVYPLTPHPGSCPPIVGWPPSLYSPSWLYVLPSFCLPGKVSFTSVLAELASKEVLLFFCTSRVSRSPLLRGGVPPNNALTNTRAFPPTPNQKDPTVIPTVTQPLPPHRELKQGFLEAEDSRPIQSTYWAKGSTPPSCRTSRWKKPSRTVKMTVIHKANSPSAKMEANRQNKASSSKGMDRRVTRPYRLLREGCPPQPCRAARHSLPIPCPPFPRSN